MPPPKNYNTFSQCSLPKVTGFPNLNFIRSTFSRKATTEGSEHRLSESSLESAFRMPPSRHEKSKWGNSDSVKNAIIGFSDGLTVPFALTAGLTSFGSQQLVVIGGIAELIAGALSMGLGAYLAASTERTAYLVREEKELVDVVKDPSAQEEETYGIFESYGLSRLRVGPLVSALKEDKETWVKVYSVPSQNRAATTHPS